jgi:uncharacterized damage-inducible protein DinB
MTYYGAKDLASAFRTVRDNTIQVANDIGEEHYGFRATPETRSVAETLIHIINIPKIAHEIHIGQKLSSLVGFDFMGFVGPLAAEEKKPHSKAEIVKLLTEGRDFTAGWMEKLTEEFLGQSVGMFPAPGNPPTKSRFEMLLGLKEHEMHHRAQLMLMGRMVGVVPHLTRRMQEIMARRQAEAQAQTQQAGKH